MEEQKEQALIRYHTFCMASDQSLDFFVAYEHLQKTLFSRFLHNFKTVDDYKHMEKADLEKPNLLLR